jgi:hypothetical protein
VRLEGLGKLKKKIIHGLGCRTHDLPACSTLPQSLRNRVPQKMMMMMKKTKEVEDDDEEKRL